MLMREALPAVKIEGTRSEYPPIIWECFFREMLSHPNAFIVQTFTKYAFNHYRPSRTSLSPTKLDELLQEVIELHQAASAPDSILSHLIKHSMTPDSELAAMVARSHYDHTISKLSSMVLHLSEELERLKETIEQLKGAAKPNSTSNTSSKKSKAPWKIKPVVPNNPNEVRMWKGEAWQYDPKANDGKGKWVTSSSSSSSGKSAKRPASNTVDRKKEAKKSKSDSTSSFSANLAEVRLLHEAAAARLHKKKVEFNLSAAARAGDN